MPGLEISGSCLLKLKWTCPPLKSVDWEIALGWLGILPSSIYVSEEVLSLSFYSVYIKVYFLELSNPLTGLPDIGMRLGTIN